MISLDDFTRKSATQNFFSHPSCCSIDYSDGSYSENYIYDVIKKAADKSIFSLELKEAIKDWPSEYHLSSVRTNILAPYDLSNHRNILELGCGCGAITRFLGESGHNVTAIEGSNRRSQIAGERCRDLENVKIYNCNFNDIDLPEGKFDIITLIGVLEYAELFKSDDSQKPADLYLLERLKKALSPTGTLIIAIENQLGYKYLAGCKEDHTNIEYEGILGYPRTSGMKTYSKYELANILKQCGFMNLEYAYPFPDYKVAVTHLSQSFIEKKEASTLLQTSFSRDYSDGRNFRIPDPILATTIGGAGLLAEFSNSFLVFAGNKKHAWANFDFVHYTSPERHPQYRVKTTKKENDPSVVRESCSMPNRVEKLPDRKIFKFTPKNELFLKGNVFAFILFKKILKADLKSFHAEITHYLAFLKESITDSDDAECPLDLTFWNVMEMDDGSLRSFDTEWAMCTEQSNIENKVSFILFRSLFFWLDSGVVSFLGFLKIDYELSTLKDVIEMIFSRQDIMLDQSTVKQFLNWEAKFQTQVANGNITGYEGVEEALTKKFNNELPENIHDLKSDLVKFQQKYLNKKKAFQELENYRVDLENSFSVIKNRCHEMEIYRKDLEENFHILKERKEKFENEAILLRSTKTNLEKQNKKQDRILNEFQGLKEKQADRLEYLEAVKLQYETIMREQVNKMDELSNQHHQVVQSRKWKFINAIIRVIKLGR